MTEISVPFLDINGNIAVNDANNNINFDNNKQYKKFTLLTSPLIVQLSGYVFFIIFGVICYFMGFASKNDFFRWGPPVTIIQYEIITYTQFYFVLLMFFVHEMMNAWISEVVYPWIINYVQDPKCKHTGYSNNISLSIVNMNVLYGTLDILFIVSSINSQISFLISIIIGKLLVVSVINRKYILLKSQ